MQIALSKSEVIEVQEELKRKYKSEIDTLEKENNEIKVAINK